VTPNTGIDTAINNAAARMTNATPSDALRAGVMSRIAVAPPRLRAWRFGVAFGVASVGLVAFLVWPHKGAPNPTISQLAISTPTLINPTIPNEPAHPTAGTAPTSPLTSVAQTVAANDSGRFVVTTDADQMRMSVPALEHPELLTPVKPLSEGAPFKAIDIEPIRVAPLVVLAIGDDNQ
jgi:hypothetical protein